MRSDRGPARACARWPPPPALAAPVTSSAAAAGAAESQAGATDCDRRPPGACGEAAPVVRQSTPVAKTPAPVVTHSTPVAKAPAQHVKPKTAPSQGQAGREAEGCRSRLRRRDRLTTATGCPWPPLPRLRPRRPIRLTTTRSRLQAAGCCSLRWAARSCSSRPGASWRSRGSVFSRLFRRPEKAASPLTFLPLPGAGDCSAWHTGDVSISWTTNQGWTAINCNFPYPWADGPRAALTAHMHACRTRPHGETYAPHGTVKRDATPPQNNRGTNLPARRTPLAGSAIPRRWRSPPDTTSGVASLHVLPR